MTEQLDSRERAQQRHARHVAAQVRREQAVAAGMRFCGQRSPENEE